MLGASSTACATWVAVSSFMMSKLVAAGTVASQRANQQRPFLRTRLDEHTIRSGRHGQHEVRLLTLHRDFFGDRGQRNRFASARLQTRAVCRCARREFEIGPVAIGIA